MSEPNFLPKTPRIETERLVLREILDEDTPQLTAILRNARCAETYLLPDYPSDEAALPLVRRLRELSRDPDRFVYGIAMKDGPLIGFLNEQTGGSAEKVVEIGYILHPDCWNRGYMTEAVGAAIRELFRRGASVVRAGHFEENASSRRVMEKNGMEPIDWTEDMDYRGRTHRVLYREIRRED